MAAEKWLARAEQDLLMADRREIIRQFITEITVGHDTITVRARVPAVQAKERVVALEISQTR